ncbi:helix-hairpin-helix domain-containing protein [Pontivivens ytuae]|uniref:Pathogenicity locus n=1 Tax=Pontivivens ytuae TaxID=2789856 RepID=A0A7S9LR06_9RHOB|nr:helix-hairpin-helix domain-containing protein [Pontivivens ytuae]QPH53410.1 hypothetical protein I0K15_16720 [Pontivivens ytuae]
MTLPERRPVTDIPGVGLTFQKDLARICIDNVEQLAGRDPGVLFGMLLNANLEEERETHRNYLYMLRMCVYYADGGRDPELLKWSAWSDRALATRP